MPIYMIERAYAEELNITADGVRLIEEVNADEGVRWLFSFLSADKRRSYRLYEAPSPDEIRAAAVRRDCRPTRSSRSTACRPTCSSRAPAW